MSCNWPFSHFKLFIFLPLYPLIETNNIHDKIKTWRPVSAYSLAPIHMYIYNDTEMIEAAQHHIFSLMANTV